jgi:hypothetical protein
MTRPLKALVVLDEGAQRRMFDTALQAIPELEVLGFVEAS